MHNLYSTKFITNMCFNMNFSLYFCFLMACDMVELQISKCKLTQVRARLVSHA